MEKTPKILTIIGLVLEGIAALSSIVFGLLFVNVDKFVFFDEIYATVPPDEQWIFDLFTGVVGVLILVMGIIIGIIFIINLILFSKLMRGDYSEETAKKIYKYQIIWGVISLLLNTLTGIFYIISGFQGFEGQKDHFDVREGI
jgi:Na+/proline symporter